MEYDIAVYPNPTSSTFYVSLSNYKDGIGINLYDITHKLVFNNQINQYINFFQLPHLSDGTYIYEILMEDEILKTGNIGTNLPLDLKYALLGDINRSHSSQVVDAQTTVLNAPLYPIIVCLLS